MPFAEVNGVRLYYEVHGDGPALVFAHGAGGNHLSWWRQVPHFSQRYRCIVFDHRHFGLSRAPHPTPESRMQFAEDLRALLDYLGVGQVLLVAQSMGGRTAVGFTLRNPGRVRALVLAGTNGGAVSEALREAQERHRASADGRRSLRERALSPRFRRERPDLALLYRMIGRLNPPRPRDFLAVPPGYRVSTAERLAASGVPILFLVGALDTITPPRIVELAHRNVPGSRFEVIPGAGHSAYLEAPEAFNAAIERFFEEAGVAPVYGSGGGLRKG
ncbi:MAG TPA: alpha/beta fold hydrolase [Dehalococcoidia bacterium]|nr:alpha/beta fold hydrolase [Dehalococcoidia bacterium]